jgi:hypothetical protein
MRRFHEVEPQRDLEQMMPPQARSASPHFDLPSWLRGLPQLDMTSSTPEKAAEWSILHAAATEFTILLLLHAAAVCHPQKHGCIGLFMVLGTQKTCIGRLMLMPAVRC